MDGERFARAVRVAVLGATGHVGRNVSKGLAAKFDLCLFARSPGRLIEFVAKEIGSAIRPEIRPLTDFPSNAHHLDAIVNCIGFGTPERIEGKGRELFGVTEYYDNLCLDYIDKNPSCVYVNISSGAVYGGSIVEPVREDGEVSLDLGNLGSTEAYRMSKLYVEAKHRCRDGRCIYDLRLFGFFSRYIELESKYLLSQMSSCLLKGQVFITGGNDIVRDYIAPADLCGLIALCIGSPGNNCSLDTYSLAPVRKMELLHMFAKEYGLRYTIVDGSTARSPTGDKIHYASASDKASVLLGYQPTLNALDSIIQEVEALRANN